MGKILAGAFMPHPPLLIPVVGGDAIEKVAKTERCMRDLSSFLVALNPTAVIILSPHGTHHCGRPTIVAFSRMIGDMANFGQEQCQIDFTVDLSLVACVASAAQEEAVPLHLLTDERVKIDSGAFVPLYFLREAGFTGSIVHICPGFMALDDEVKLGKAIKKAVADYDNNVILLGSGDLSHYLKEYPPYGFRPEGVEFDQKIVESIKDNDLSQIFSLEGKLIERAGECGLRSLVIVMSALCKMVTEFYSYEDTFGVGYAVALWANVPHNRSLPARLAQLVLKKHLAAPEKELQLPAWTDVLTGQAGVFVSLKKEGILRGCIGTFLPQCTSLRDEIANNAIAAACEDPRFSPVTYDELPKLDISVDILSAPERACSLDELDAKKYGVIVVQGDKRGLLLPDLEGVDSVEQQVQIAMQKAGIPLDTQIDLYKFSVERYV